MAQKDSRRLKIVMLYLYPDLENSTIGDYSLQNDSNGTRTFVVWHNNDIPEPTEQEIADAKEPALNAHWWKVLRVIRDILLVESDWSQGADVPSDLKASYATYRTDLRDLPDNVTKPDFDTLNNQSIKEWDISSLMPTKP
jgi:L-rhamnose mutarotase|tara:strand:+ start:626 stop:1045 length:420 start_codon:yes stop_codon:yes gene_type:complete